MKQAQIRATESEQGLLQGHLRSTRALGLKVKLAGQASRQLVQLQMEKRQDMARHDSSEPSQP